MKLAPDDPTEVVPVPAVLAAYCEPVWVPTANGPDAPTLARAFRHGSRARPHFPGWAFEGVEDELRAGWLLNGEAARWGEVREAVRAGFEAG